ncbi:MAG: serine/threonine protein kinase [Candidatus Zixiibacteriota bacterium]|nr:MAG: serine/threonine protein kinase [candidate division Zixibacteria bacterium]
MVKEGEFEGFRVEEVLSRSSTTTVYRAFQHSLKRPVLIKELRPDLLREADILNRFRREAEVCARIKHENIVDIYDCSIQPDRVFLVMEYVAGCSLADLIQRHPQPPLPLILAVMHQILRGLAYAHAQQVIHRDIKPGNILVSREGWVKITDFGLAICEGFDAVTQAGAVVGTPAYLSPESISGGAVTARSDLFSLGVTFYQVITGEKIFSAEHFSDSLRKVLSDHPPELSRYRPDLPPELGRIVLRMLEKSPAKRWASADEILAALESQGQGMPLGESKALIRGLMDDPNAVHTVADRTPSTPPVRPPRAAPLVRIAAALAVVLLVVAGYYLLSGPGQPPAVPVVDSTALGAVQIPDTTATAAAMEVEDTLKAAPGEIAMKPVPPPETKDSEPARSQGSPPAALRDTIPAPQPRVEESRPRTDLAATAIVDSAQMASTAPGTIRVQCDPWAEVYLNDVLVDRTPFAPLQVNPGRHKLGFNHPTFPPVVREIEVLPGREVLVVENLWHTVGRIMVIVPDAWAEVYIGDQKRGITPLNEALIVPLGKHKVTLKNAAFNTWDTTVTCRRGAPPCTLRVNMRNHNGSLTAPDSPDPSSDDSTHLSGSLLPARRDSLSP